MGWTHASSPVFVDSASSLNSVTRFVTSVLLLSDARYFAATLARLEPLSHILVWSATLPAKDTGADFRDSDECEITL